MAKNPEQKNGARNLVLLGVISILIASATTGISLAIYHKSGDIYLDRSRPGFLPDEEEIEEDEEKEPDDDYEFWAGNRITAELVDEYLKQLDEEVKAIDAYEKPFEEGVLSDENLGIPMVEEAEQTE